VNPLRLLSLSETLVLSVLLASCGGHATPKPAESAAAETAGPKAGAAPTGTAEKSVAAEGAAAPAAKASGPAEDATADSAPVPIKTVHPIARKVSAHVEAFGRAILDPLVGRTVTLATVGEIRAVEVVTGQTVAAGQVLFRVAPDPAARLAGRQAETALTLAKAEFARVSEQRADNLATATQVDTARKAVEDAEAGVDAARQLGAAAAEESVRAPIAGVVMNVAANVGDRPAVGTVVAAIAPSRPARVVLGIEPSDQRRVHSGDRVAIRAVQPGAEARPGRVAVVGASIDKDSHLVTVIASLEPAKDDGGLLAGGAVEATIETAAVDAFVIPRAALVKDDAGNPSVFEIVDGKAHRVAVVIEADEGARVAVSGALDPGRPVAATGAYELDDGSSVVETRP
jgi:RND family efflux transporter MFP subunit